MNCNVIKQPLNRGHSLFLLFYTILQDSPTRSRHKFDRHKINRAIMYSTHVLLSPQLDKYRRGNRNHSLLAHKKAMSTRASHHWESESGVGSEPIKQFYSPAASFNYGFNPSLHFISTSSGIITIKSNFLCFLFYFQTRRQSKVSSDG